MEKKSQMPNDFPVVAIFSDPEEEESCKMEWSESKINWRNIGR